MAESLEATTDTQATISVTSQGEAWGDIVLKFYPEVAPGHVRNFCKLASEQFYNGTTFHRVIPGFMIQGGDPNSKNADRSTHGMGGPGLSSQSRIQRHTTQARRALDGSRPGSR